ncbi:hypothetical protein M422DRAFT_267906 [Sphaerobolus stellatus SS14]|uniref:Uncharacterized protein n=1 Tax=Sphaerobolus stellatus (strain SS14) TaxID=990650 RepID=A0A0C9UNV3_SPHS4|nr:hypothetical protein M422DRAFT_267906 [Sphaerobolus stellatus SS14]
MPRGRARILVEMEEPVGDESSIKHLRRLIEWERAQALNGLIEEFRAKRKTLPRKLPEDWTSPHVIKLEAQIKKLEQMPGVQDHNNSDDDRTEPQGCSFETASMMTDGTASQLPAIMTSPKPISKRTSTSSAKANSPPVALGDLPSLPSPAPNIPYLDDNDDLAPSSYKLNEPVIVLKLTEQHPAQVPAAADVMQSPSLPLPSPVSPTDPAAAAGDNNDDDTVDSAKRPGNLSKEQLHILRDQQALWDKWINDRAREWKVKPITITANMGVDHREQRTTSFWNKFQAVFWDEVGEEDWAQIRAEVEGRRKKKTMAETGEAWALQNEPIMPPSKLELLKQHCSDEYSRFDRLTKDSNLTEEERKTLVVDKKRIEEKYEQLHDPKNIAYREGDTQKLFRQARKEFTTRSMYYWTRGVAIFGVMVSVDPVDPTASACNLVFAGSDAVRKYLDSQKANMRILLRDFETFCRSEEQDERKRHNLSLGQLYRAHMDHNGQRRSEIATLLKEMWAKAMDHAIPYAVPWDRWPNDMIALQSCLDGWPDDVPWPGGPKAYKALEASKVTAMLWPYICNQKEGEVQIVPWSQAEIDLAKRMSPAELEMNETYQSIYLVCGASGKPLLTMSEVAEQAAARLADKRAIKRREADRINEDSAPKSAKRKAQENSDTESSKVLSESSKKRKADDKTVKKPTEHAKNSIQTSKTGKKTKTLDTIVTRQVNIGEEAVKARAARQGNRPKSREYVDDDDVDIAKDGVPSSALCKGSPDVTPTAPSITNAHVNTSGSGSSGVAATSSSLENQMTALPPASITSAPQPSLPNPNPGTLNIPGMPGLNMGSMNFNQMVQDAVNAQIRQVLAAQLSGPQGLMSLGFSSMSAGQAGGNHGIAVAGAHGPPNGVVQNQGANIECDVLTNYGLGSIDMVYPNNFLAHINTPDNNQHASWAQ